MRAIVAFILAGALGVTAVAGDQAPAAAISAAPVLESAKLPNHWNIQELAIRVAKDAFPAPTIWVLGPWVNRKGSTLWWREEKVAPVTPHVYSWYDHYDVNLVRMDLSTGAVRRVSAPPECWDAGICGVDRDGNAYVELTTTPGLPAGVEERRRLYGPDPETDEAPTPEVEREFVRVDSLGGTKVLINFGNDATSFPEPMSSVSEDGRSLIHTSTGFQLCSSAGELKLIPQLGSPREALVAPNGDVYYAIEKGGVGVLRNNARVTLIPGRQLSPTGYFAVNRSGEVVTSMPSELLVYSGGRMLSIKPPNNDRQFTIFRGTVGIDDHGNVFFSTGIVFLAMENGIWFWDAQKQEITPLIVRAMKIGSRIVNAVGWINENVDAEGNLYADVEYESGEEAFVRVSRGPALTFSPVTIR